MIINYDSSSLIAKVAQGRVEEPLNWPTLVAQLKNALRRITGDSADGDNNVLLNKCTELLDNRNAPPFTIQRICELIINSDGADTGKLLATVERLLLVESACTDRNILGPHIAH